MTPFPPKEAVSPLETPSGNADVQSETYNFSMAGDLKALPPEEYILGPGDTLDISVFRRDELAMKTTISPTGRISYYLVGDIQAAGLTQFQLRDEIATKLSQFIKEPKVVVRISEFKSHKIYILGQVNNPGVYAMSNAFSLVEAISSAGGTTSDAYLGGAYLVRDEKILLVNFFELLEKGNMAENIPLQANDVIYIPDNRDQKVFVVGEVNNQKAVPIREDLTLLEAIVEAGGFTQDAKKDGVVVMRGNLSAPEIIRIDSEQTDLGANILLRRGDIVYVASSAIANVERAAIRISHILRPLYDVARSIVWGDAAVRVLDGERSRLIVEDE